MAVGFPGLAFVANEEGRSIAAVDLTTFSVRKEIAIDGNPTAILSHWRSAVYALTPRTGTVHEIDPVSLSVRRKARAAGSAVSMRLSADTRSIWVLSAEARALVQLTLDTFQPAARIKLPATPADFDLTKERVAISLPAESSVALASLRSGSVERMLPAGPNVQTIRFHDDGRQLWCGARGDRTVTEFDVERARMVTRLPVALEPENFCFKADGGELYITGPGLDAVVVIQPYQSEVYETRGVGKSPRAMALSPDYLFVANRDAGAVTVMNIVTGKVGAVLAVGSEPRHIVVTPDNQYALALNGRSGDMAVIWIEGFFRKTRGKNAPTPLFTMIPVGAKPVSAAVRPA